MIFSRISLHIFFFSKPFFLLLLKWIAYKELLICWTLLPFWCNRWHQSFSCSILWQKVSSTCVAVDRLHRRAAGCILYDAKRIGKQKWLQVHALILMQEYTNHFSRLMEVSHTHFHVSTNMLQIYINCYKSD